MPGGVDDGVLALAVRMRLRGADDVRTRGADPLVVVVDIVDPDMTECVSPSDVGARRLWLSSATMSAPSPNPSCARWSPIRRCSTNPNVCVSHSTAAATSGYERTGVTDAGGAERLRILPPSLACSDGGQNWD